MTEKVFVGERDVRRLGWALEEAALKDAVGVVAAGLSPIATETGLYLTLPEGYTVEEMPARYPLRKKGTATARDLDSFISYINRQKDDAAIAFYDDRRFTVFLNHHDPSDDDGEAGWADHKAIFEPKWKVGWTAWTGFDDAWQTQQAFAEFLEERIGEIAEPAGGLLLEIATRLRVKLNVTYEKAINLANGTVQLVYTEEMTTGEITIPENFTLVLVPFVGAEAVEIKAKLRISPPNNQGGVRFMFKLGERVEEIIEEAFGQMAETVTGATGVPVLRGSWGS